MSHQKILILDFGSQYTQLIARRVREQQVYCELHPFDVSEEFIRELRAARASSSPAARIRSTRHETPRAPQVVFELGVPVLGICYGMQTMAQQLGGKVESAGKREFGYAEVRARGHSSLFNDIQDRTNAEGHGLLDVWMSHGDKVTELPPGFKVIGSNDVHARSPAWPTRHAASTPCSSTRRSPTPSRARRSSPASCTTSAAAAATGTCRITSTRRSPRCAPRSASDEVILGLSGGVDSSVVAALLHRAIGDQLTCVFVDNGLLRLNEGEQVMETFARNLGVKVIHVDATEQFMGHLDGRRRPGAEAQDHRPRVRRGLPGRSRQAAATPNGWRRAPSIRT